ncbi:MAG TPA: VWA domain-containing protein [Pseudonocardiaceae bacterium]|jgi:uncharacterized protein YegL|nr:VWA domain-containing protein [Pseudonocardiaceae bacterium]
MTESAALDALPVQPAKNRLLITLIVDTSSSMNEAGRITELNTALRKWRDELQRNDYVRQHGEIALITFGKDHVRAIDPSGRTRDPAAEPYVPVTRFNPPDLEAGGVTPMIEGIQHAFKLLAVRRQQLRATYPLANRPLVYLITDGVPTDATGHASDDWQRFAGVIRQQEAGKHLLFFAFGVAGAQEDVLAGLAPRAWHLLRNAEFNEVLRMVSTSIEAATAADAHNEPADTIYHKVEENLAKRDRIERWMREQG